MLRSGAVAAGCGFVVFLTSTLNNPLIDDHSFRHTQTAISTFHKQITPRMSVFGGYMFLYASNVVRAPQPSFRFNASDFWAQGLNVGVALRC